MCIMLSISKVRNTIAFFLIIEHYGGGWQTHNSRSQVSDIRLFPYWSCCKVIICDNTLVRFLSSM